MEFSEKIKILASGARYDVSCSSSGSHRAAVKGQLGSATESGICHSWTKDGRCISLLKLLMSNNCIYDCKYCINRASAKFKRATFTVEELVNLTIDFYRRNYIEGLFLSSGVIKNPDHTMEQMIEVVRTLRSREYFNGYIHMKVIPGADCRLIEKAGRLVDRLSINTEVPSTKNLLLLAPQKQMKNILNPINYIDNRILELANTKWRKDFVPAGQTTQVLIGASDDTDFNILNMSEYMYKQKHLKRVYYSAFIPLKMDDQHLPSLLNASTTREHRLYQADWLLRFYGFKVDDLLSDKYPNFDLSIDPKAFWALTHLNQFPVEVNSAPLEMLLRVPGIGPISARRILMSRRLTKLDYDGLKRIGVVLKRATYFITVSGKYYGKCAFEDISIKQRLINADNYGNQISLLDIATHH